MERWQGGCFSARDDENEDTLLLDTEYFSQPVFPTKSEEGPGFDELDHVREWASQPASSSDFISFLDDDSETLQPLPSDKLHSPEKPPLVQAEASHIHTLKRPAEEKLPTDDATEPIQLHNAVQLMDAAIRNLICNKPLRTAAGIKLLGDKSKPIAKLADLAPALWSPGYLPVSRIPTT